MTGYLAGLTGPVVATTGTVVAVYPAPASAPEHVNPAGPVRDSPMALAPDPTIDDCPASCAPSVQGTGESSPAAGTGSLSTISVPAPARPAGQAYDAVVRDIVDHRELLDLTTSVRHRRLARHHGAHHSATAGDGGETPARFDADRFAATACDQAECAGVAGASSLARAYVDMRSTADGPGASATPNPGGARQFPFGTGADGASSGGVTSIPPTARTGEAARHHPFSTN